MTVIPLFATYNVTCPDFHSVHTARDGMYYVLCGMTTTRILRSLRFGSSFSAISDEVRFEDRRHDSFQYVCMHFLPTIGFCTSLFVKGHVTLYGCIMCVLIIQTLWWCNIWRKNMYLIWFDLFELYKKRLSFALLQLHTSFNSLFLNIWFTICSSMAHHTSGCQFHQLRKPPKNMFTIMQNTNKPRRRKIKVCTRI